MPCRTMRALQLRHRAPVHTFHQSHILVSRTFTCQSHQPQRRRCRHTRARHCLTGYPALFSHLPSQSSYELADVLPCLSRHPRIAQALERRMSIADRTRAAAKRPALHRRATSAVANRLCTISGYWPLRGSIATGVAQTSQRSKESPLPTSQAQP
jgi:hypothetical protein